MISYHNSWAYDNGYTDQYWQTLGTKWVFDEGYFNVYINGVNTTYTANGEQEIVFAAVDVKSRSICT